jgi:hypothetical protein
MSSLDGAIILTVVVAWLYFSGALHTSAYYRELGLAGYAPSYEFHSIVMTGASSLISGTLVWYVWLVLAAEVLFLVAIVWALIRSLRRVRSKFAYARRERARFWRSTPRTTAVTRVDLAVSWFEGFSKPFAYGFLLLAFVVTTALIAEHQGATTASNLRRGFTESGLGSRVVFLSNGRRVRLGPRVGCDSVVCAYLASDGVIVFRRERIDSEAVVVPLDDSGRRRKL